MAQSLIDSRRMVIKLGSALLVDQASGRLHEHWLASFIEDVVMLRQQGIEVILVSSGAIAIGREVLGLNAAQCTLSQLQAAAATGQIQLAHAYQKLLAAHDVQAAQVLLTWQDSENRKQFLNAKNTLESLLQLGVVPIVNENDSVATAELCYGDNDRLAARLAQMVAADTLVLLSDIDGLYDDNPTTNPQARFIPEVTELSSQVVAMAKDSVSSYGSGGMTTKLAAAKIVLASGCRLLITAGAPQRPISHYIKAQRGTWFIPSTTPKAAKKTWLSQHLKPHGGVVIDAGSEQALLAGRSLLPVGIVAVDGLFDKGSVLSIRNAAGAEVARGLSNYRHDEILKIKGQQSSHIITLLHYAGQHEVVHRDNLVLIGKG